MVILSVTEVEAVVDDDFGEVGVGVGPKGFAGVRWCSLLIGCAGIAEEGIRDDSG